MSERLRKLSFIETQQDQKGGTLRLLFHDAQYRLNGLLSINHVIECR